MNARQLSHNFVRTLITFGFALSGIVACSVGSDAVGSASQNDTTPPPPAGQCTLDPSGDPTSCLLCCTGDGPAKQVVQTAIQCLTACGEKDETCQDACYQAYDTACQPLGDACANFENCADASCSGDDPCGGGGGGGGDDDDDNAKTRNVLAKRANNGGNGGNCGNR